MLRCALLHTRRPSCRDTAHARATNDFLHLCALTPAASTAALLMLRPKAHSAHPSSRTAAPLTLVVADGVGALQNEMENCAVVLGELHIHIGDTGGRLSRRGERGDRQCGSSRGGVPIRQSPPKQRRLARCRTTQPTLPVPPARRTERVPCVNSRDQDDDAGAAEISAAGHIAQK